MEKIRRKVDRKISCREGKEGQRRRVGRIGSRKWKGRRRIGGKNNGKERKGRKKEEEEGKRGRNREGIRGRIRREEKEREEQ